MFWRTKIFERFAPMVFGVFTLAALIFWRVNVAQQFGPGGWGASSLYSAVFNWSSIQSGFVFGIYGFIAAKKDGFAGVVSKSRSFNQFLSYTRRAYFAGFSLTFLSIPIMVIDPAIEDPYSNSYWMVACWFATFVWTFCAFLRVAFIFGMITAVPDEDKRIIG